MIYTAGKNPPGRLVLLSTVRKICRKNIHSGAAGHFISCLLNRNIYRLGKQRSFPCRSSELLSGYFWDSNVIINAKNVKICDYMRGTSWHWFTCKWILIIYKCFHQFNQAVFLSLYVHMCCVVLKLYFSCVSITRRPDSVWPGQRCCNEAVSRRQRSPSECSADSRLPKVALICSLICSSISYVSPAGYDPPCQEVRRTPLEGKGLGITVFSVVAERAQSIIEWETAQQKKKAKLCFTHWQLISMLHREVKPKHCNMLSGAYTRSDISRHLQGQYNI